MNVLWGRGLCLAFAVLFVGSPVSAQTEGVRFSVARERPAAERTFVAVAAVLGETPAESWRLFCDGSIGRRAVPGNVRALYGDDTTKPATLVCSWRIPRGTSGKVFTVRYRASVLTGPIVVLTPVATVRWKVR